MEFVASIIDNVFRPLKDFFARSFGYVASCGGYVEALADEMNELKSKRDDVKRMVDAAERQGMEPTSQAREVVAGERGGAGGARGEDRGGVPGATGAPPEQAAGMWSTYQLSKQADETLAEARNWKDKGAFHKVADDLVHVRFEEMPTVPAVGMSHLLEQLRACVVGDDDVGLVGIHGMPADFDLDEIQKVIGDRLGLSWDRKSPKERAVVLYKVLSKMNFVLLLDDLWEPLNLRMLGVPVPKQRSKSKIILTTRIEDVCDRMDVRRKIKVDCLPWGEAWELFQEKVGEALVRSNPEIRRHAEELAAKCGGLPLALITVGRAMASKRTAKEWKHAITVLRIAPWQLLGMEGDLLRHLKHSYDNLQKRQAPDLPAVLLPVPGGVLDLQGVDHRVLHRRGVHRRPLHRDGRDLQQGPRPARGAEDGLPAGERDDEDHIKMHPMIRAMALWIASEFGPRRPSGSSAPDRTQGGSRGREVGRGRADFADAEQHSRAVRDAEQPQSEDSDAAGEPRVGEDLRRLLPVHAVAARSRSLPHFDRRTAVGAQRLIRPAVPRPLQHEHPVAAAGAGSAGELAVSAPLQHAPRDDRERGDRQPGDAAGAVHGSELRGLEGRDRRDRRRAPGARGLRRLKALDITIQTVDALQRLSRSHRLAGSMRNLLMKGCGGLTRIQLPSSDLWRNMNGLKRVWIVGCGDLEEVVIDGSKDGDEMPTLPSLQSVNYQGRGSFIDDELPILPSLQSIILQGLQKAKIIYKGGCVQHLTSLDVWLCIGLEQLITFEDAVDGEADGEEPRVVAAFPALKELHLNRLPTSRASATVGLCWPSLRWRSSPLSSARS
uniref:NB-ARC domain-containing protein n=1 Tax=Ananas comosus var. bracteatus TaxID=296719 RepID=A0A6V7QDV1_ANACO|nr:unnamed protein product [Ananas comosus var. bracteatus]